VRPLEVLPEWFRMHLGGGWVCLFVPVILGVLLVALGRGRRQGASSVVACPRCGALARPGARYCHRCGERVA
jgi:hypothetical protein